LTEIRSLLATKLAKCYVTALEPGESLKTNLALNGAQDRIETIEQDASDKVDKLRFTANIDALSRINRRRPKHHNDQQSLRSITFMAGKGP
jgi:tRNA G37 N-methylase Trm5